MIYLYCTYNAINFEWDENKNSSNRKKHGVAFEEARTVFLDEQALLSHDPDHSDEEDRYLLIGLSNQPRALTIAHCYKEEDSIIRIISARKSNKKEIALYEERLS